MKVSDWTTSPTVVGNAAVLFRNKDVNDLERQLQWALSNEKAVSQLAARGKQRVNDFFTWERVTDQLEALYKRVSYGVKRQDSLVEQAAA